MSRGGGSGQTEDRAVWNTRIAAAMRPRFVVHSHSGLRRAFVAEALIERQTAGNLVKIREHHPVQQTGIPGDHHTSMVRLERYPVRDILLAKLHSRNFPRLRRIRDIQTDN